MVLDENDAYKGSIMIYVLTVIIVLNLEVLIINATFS
jgi:hypothetical protein